MRDLGEIHLSEKLLGVLERSIQAIVRPDLIEDWEFSTVVGGYSRNQVASLVPLNNPLTDEELDICITVIGNLVGYPHGKEKVVEENLGITLRELDTCREKLISLKKA